MLGGVEHIYFIDTVKNQWLEAVDYSEVEVFMISQSSEFQECWKCTYAKNSAAVFPPGNFDICITLGVTQTSCH